MHRALLSISGCSIYGQIHRPAVLQFSRTRTVQSLLPIKSPALGLPVIKRAMSFPIKRIYSSSSQMHDVLPHKMLPPSATGVPEQEEPQKELQQTYITILVMAQCARLTAAFTSGVMCWRVPGSGYSG
eukprot:1162022-Pelagomonas_calceolata.AAC.5